MCTLHVLFLVLVCDRITAPLTDLAWLLQRFEPLLVFLCGWTYFYFYFLFFSFRINECLGKIFLFCLGKAFLVKPYKLILFMDNIIHQCYSVKWLKGSQLLEANGSGARYLEVLGVAGAIAHRWNSAVCNKNKYYHLLHLKFVYLIVLNHTF